MVNQNFIKELSWRGMIHDVIPETEEYLMKGSAVGYAGFDPTADSLHIGSLLPLTLLAHLQRAGHKPIAVVGGATGMIGDPSGKSAERNLLTIEEIQHNVDGVQKQIERFLDFSEGPNKAEILNNYEWYKDYNVLDFMREVGKHLTVSYMMAKDSVKSRLETGLSFTEFTYQLLQAYDYYYLNKNHNCTLQIGGSDQWGNITSGVEIIRRMGGTDSFALTCPLITKPDGGKFGKTEEGNVWLDREKTSPYKFYQFWMNCPDEECEKYIKIFTFLSEEEINAIVADHAKAPHERLMQNTLAKEMTIRVHSEHDHDIAIKASQILFGKATKDILAGLNEEDFIAVFDGVPQHEVSRDLIRGGANLYDLLTEQTGIFPSKGELRRTIQGGGLSLNKEKIGEDKQELGIEDLLNDHYVLVQKGKKNYFIIKAN